MKKINYFGLIVLASFVAIVSKMFIHGSINFAESSIALSAIAYFAFCKYTEWNKAKSIQADYEERLKSLENKLIFLSGGSMINQKSNKTRRP
jgi:hypothetical protein